MNTFSPSKRFMSILLLALALIFAGCQGEEETAATETAKPSVASVDVAVGTSAEGLTTDSSTDTQTAPISLAFLGQAVDITQVNVTVMEGATVLIDSQPLILSGTSYTGTLDALPVDPLLTFIAKGLNAQGVKIYEGQGVQVLTGVQDQVALILNPIDDGKTNQIPKIAQVVHAPELERGQTTSVEIHLEASASENLLCDFTADTSGGSFNPTQVAVTLAPDKATGICQSQYTAPNTIGPVTLAAKVGNSQDNSTEVTFDLKVTHVKTKGGVTVSIAPSIAGLDARIHKKTGAVTLTARVSDDGPKAELCYHWFFNDDDTVFKNATVNPTSFTGYDPTIAGTLRLVVTDNNCTGQSTTLTYQVNVGQWAVQ